MKIIIGNIKLTNLVSNQSKPLKGEILVPGDKSISHRALIIGSMAVGRTIINGILESEDIISTSNALKDLGISIYKQDSDKWFIDGNGISGFKTPNKSLNLGNSGTGIRLLMGAISGSNIIATFIGDDSLSKRPMLRIIKPLELMGASILKQNSGKIPITLSGPKELVSIKYKSPVASAQIKSALLLAGLAANGISEIIEPIKSRDHTENMLNFFGAAISSSLNKEGNNTVKLKGQPYLKAQNFIVPSDPSSAAFPIVASLIIPGSKIKINDMMINPTRIGLIDTLKEMGAKISLSNHKTVCGENTATIHAEYSKLKGVTVPASRAASMIDEYPILCIAASKAEGNTFMKGISELRLKESDRIKMISSGLNSSGIKTIETEDSLNIFGGNVKGGCKLKSNLDHRIAMSFLILGLVAKEPIVVQDCDTINSSFPNFKILMKKLGANISGANF